jgi:5-methyltetrahydrofolate--homocysteine methyltransferase
MHQRVRMELWGYAADETLSNDELILEKYQGIRPAPGYPAQPDHKEKTTIFRLLDAERNAGVTLTESLAMWPGSSVSGIYYSHPQSEYFGVGKIERDQVEDYAERIGATMAETERSLASVLNYIPDGEPQPPAAAEDDIASLPPAQHPPGCGCVIHMRLNMKPRTDARPD